MKSSLARFLTAGLFVWMSSVSWAASTCRVTSSAEGDRLNLPGDQTLYFIMDNEPSSSVRETAVKLLSQPDGDPPQGFLTENSQTIEVMKRTLESLGALLSRRSFHFVAFPLRADELHKRQRAAVRLYLAEKAKREPKVWDDVLLTAIGAPLFLMYRQWPERFIGVSVVPFDPNYGDPSHLHELADREAEKAVRTFARSRKTLRTFRRFEKMVRSGSSFVKTHSDDEIRHLVDRYFWRKATPVVNRWLDARLKAIHATDGLYVLIRKAKVSGIFVIEEKEREHLETRLVRACESER